MISLQKLGNVRRNTTGGCVAHESISTSALYSKLVQGRRAPMPHTHLE